MRGQKHGVYSEFKPSENRWLGNIPAHWSVKKLKFLANTFASNVDKKSKAGELPVKLCNYTDVYYNDVVSPDLPFMKATATCASKFLSKTGWELSRHVPEGSSLICCIGSIGKVGIVEECVSTNQQITAATFHQNPKYGFFLICAAKEVLGVESTGNVVRILNTERLGRVLLPHPSATEQIQITKFLDYETAKIDALIEKQQHLIALLKEKRQAVISHAVTKGLNPDAPMRDSGVEWLGAVPAHWTVGKCGFYLNILPGFAFPSTGFSNNENDVRLLRGINVAVSKIRWEETARWKKIPGDGLEPYQMAENDLVLGMDRPLIAEGVRVAKIGRSDLPCLILQRVARLKTGDRLSSDYLMRILSSDIFEAHFSPETTGVSVPHISPSQIANFVIPIPPIEEQMKIVAYLDTQIGKLGALAMHASEAKELLRERRTALISAAVTGKIDVRGWKAPDAATEAEAA